MESMWAGVLCFFAEFHDRLWPPMLELDDQEHKTHVNKIEPISFGAAKFDMFSYFIPLFI
jgi:hypothetical protein